MHPLFTTLPLNNHVRVIKISTNWCMETFLENEQLQHNVDKPYGKIESDGEILQLN
jgi:hypothetical protein